MNLKSFSKERNKKTPPPIFFQIIIVFCITFVEKNAQGLREKTGQTNMLFYVYLLITPFSVIFCCLFQFPLVLIFVKYSPVYSRLDIFERQERKLCYYFFPRLFLFHDGIYYRLYFR